MSRRMFLRSASIVSLSASMFGLSSKALAGEQSRTNQTRVNLISVASLMFPHRNMVSVPYESAVDSFALEDDESAFIHSLSSSNIGIWATLDHSSKVKVLESLEETPYFIRLLNHTRGQLYSNPIVWETIGYGGPSAHLGGYLHRGFNDIDWLPKSDTVS